MFDCVERGCRARLVVVLEETSQAVLVVEARVEMFADRAGVTSAQTVVEAFVIAVVEAQLLQSP